MNSLWRTIAMAARASCETGMNGLMSWNWRRLAVLPGYLAVFAVPGVVQMPPPVTLRRRLSRGGRWLSDEVPRSLSSHGLDSQFHGLDRGSMT